MLPNVCAVMAYLIAALAIYGSYTQVSALHLRQASQMTYLPRHGTSLSGRYYNNRWERTVNRSTFGNFRGGGIGAGK